MRERKKRGEKGGGEFLGWILFMTEATIKFIFYFYFCFGGICLSISRTLFNFYFAHPGIIIYRVSNKYVFFPVPWNLQSFSLIKPGFSHCNNQKWHRKIYVQIFIDLFIVFFIFACPNNSVNLNNDFLFVLFINLATEIF